MNAAILPEQHSPLMRRMLLIRYLESGLQKLCDQGLAGDLHFNRGQEAIAVGVCAALRPTDHIVTHHRTIAHYIAKAMSSTPPLDFSESAMLHSLICELLGRKEGCNGGRAGEMHLSNAQIGYDFSFQLVGTCVPVAAGLAWGLKNHHGDDAIVACFCGDAATANGQFHEGVNIAAIHKLPILFVCEDNHRAGNITREHYMPQHVRLADRFYAFAMPIRCIDGNDVDDVTAMAQELSEHIRRSRLGPAALICDTERLCWHKQGQRDARTPEELAKAAERDPLRDVEIPGDIRETVDAAIARALRAPMAEPFEYAREDWSI